MGSRYLLLSGVARNAGRHFAFPPTCLHCGLGRVMGGVIGSIKDPKDTLLVLPPIYLRSALCAGSVIV